MIERSQAEHGAIVAKEFVSDLRQKRPGKTAEVDRGPGKPLQGVDGF